jgi:hypothetical protein
MGSIVNGAVLNETPDANRITNIVWILFYMSGVICHEKRSKLSLIYPEPWERETPGRGNCLGWGISSVFNYTLFICNPSIFNTRNAGQR